MKKISSLSSSGLPRLGWRIILLDSGISLFLGLLVALIGGSLTTLGNGAGGGNGIPDLFFTLALLLGIPGLYLGVRGMIKRDEKQTQLALTFIGPLIISLGYILIAHTFDPCENGLWDLNSQIGETIPLCERFGSGINIHTRFHYLWHIVPTLPLVWLYGVLLKKRLPEALAKSQEKE